MTVDAVTSLSGDSYSELIRESYARKNLSVDSLKKQLSDGFSVDVSVVMKINGQFVKKARVHGGNYWHKRQEDEAVILLAGDLAIQYIDKVHQLSCGEIFQLHRHNYYKMVSLAGADIIHMGNSLQ